MRTLSQARNNAAKLPPAAPATKHKNSPRHLRGFAVAKSPLAVLAAEPLAHREAFELELDWIGDTMEPEICQGNLATVKRRPEMTPCANELALGLLHSGELVFGAYAASDDGNGLVIQIGFINPKYSPAYYWPESFSWLYPVEYVSMLDPTRKFRRIMKTIEFEVGTEGNFPVPADL